MHYETPDVVFAGATRVARRAFVASAAVAALLFTGTVPAAATATNSLRCLGQSFFSAPTGDSIFYADSAARATTLNVVATPSAALQVQTPTAPLVISNNSRSAQAIYQCRHVGSHAVTVPGVTERLSFLGMLGPGDDRAAIDFTRVRVYSGGELDGQDGADTLILRGGKAPFGYKVNGGPGDDHLTVSWPDPPAQRCLSEDRFDGNFHPAKPGGLYGFCSPTFLDAAGGPGDDELQVAAPTRQNRSLVLSGALGHHQFVLSGGAGNDRLQGNTGDDELDGGPGNDVIVGAGGIDDLEGGPGNDVIELSVANSPDTSVDCGPGSDTLILHGAPMPNHVAGCEAVQP